MKKEMLINVLQPEECRIAIVEDGVLEELYVERASQESYVGNIYKGKVVNIEPGIQAVFIDFGIGRNGFLHVTDVDPVYYKHLLPRELLEELQQAERDDRGRPASRGPSSSRDDRGSRSSPRDDQRERSPRYAEAEAVESVPFVPPSAPAVFAPSASSMPAAAAAPPPVLTKTNDDEVDEFFIGLDDESPEGSRRATTAPAATTPAAPVAAVSTPQTVKEPVKEASPGPAPQVPVAPAASVKYVTDDDFADFGAGLDFDHPQISPKHAAPDTSCSQAASPDSSSPTLDLHFEATADASPNSANTPVVESVADTAGEHSSEAVVEPASELIADAGDGEDSSEDKPARGRGRPKNAAKKIKAKADESDSKADGDEKPRSKSRRTKKKADGEEPDSDDKPRPMESAERRTTDDDEPEIRPFFEGGAMDDFDIEGPNDRFANSTEEDGEETESFDSEEAVEVEESTEPADEFEPYTAPSERPRRDDGGRGGRGRDGGGRDRDRGGPRGDRGPRSGGGGDRGGPRRGNGPPLKAHTRHKGLPIPPIQDIFKRGQEVIVQVIKEGMGTKGPTLSTFVSIAGRYLVLMPSLNRVGVSRKIEDRDARHRLRDIMNKLSPPKGVGFIVRTAAVDQSEQELQSDLAYLLRLWQVVVKRIRKVAAPVEIYRESDMITRTIRDIFSKDIDTIWVDEEHAFAAASEFLQIVMPNYASRIRYHGAGGETEPLFHRYRVEDEIAKINHKRLDLPGGGSIIIEQTEALVSIDVNSGNFRADNNAEETAFQMNLRAAKEIARQLRLRDLGGVIVNDFIDMRSESHRRKVEDALRDGLRRDRARTKILRISEFGLIEMTRQRMQPSLKKRVYNECPHCVGTGYIKTNETMGIEVMRLLHLAAHRTPSVSCVQLIVQADVAFHILNRKRREIAALEAKAGMEVQIQGLHGVSPDLCEAKCFDANGTEVRLIGGAQPRALKPGSAHGSGGGSGPRPDNNGGDRGRYRRNDD